MKKFSQIVLTTAIVGLLAACGGTSSSSSSASSEVPVEGKTWAETYDALISDIKTSRSTTVAEKAARYEKLHKAEDLLMSTGAILPIYNYTDIYMKKTTLDGFFSVPLGYKYFQYASIDGAAGSDIVTCLASEPATIDPALNSAVDGATYIVHAFSGLVGYQEVAGVPTLVPDSAEALPEPVENLDGTVTYTFTLRTGLKWSDGSEFKASDFVYSWNRAASNSTASDYQYMFEAISGFSYDQVDDHADLDVVADDTARTLAVTLPVDVPYFYELMAFPTYFPVKQSVVEANPEGWTLTPETYVGNGALRLTTYSGGEGGELVFEKNPNYWNASAVKPATVTFSLYSSDTTVLQKYLNNDFIFIDTVPNAEIVSLRTQYPEEYFVAGQLGTYYAIFNINDPVLADFTELEREKIRKGLSLLLDRNYVVTAIGKAGQTPARSFVATGITEVKADGTVVEFASRSGPNRDGAGYYSTSPLDFSANCVEGIGLLAEVAASSGAFTVNTETGQVSGFPNISYLFNTSTGHAAIAAYIQSAFAIYGISMPVTSQEWATFLQTRKDGNYSIARNGWLADFNDPISFLDMWTTQSGNNDAQFGRDAHADYAGYSIPE